MSDEWTDDSSEYFSDEDGELFDWDEADEEEDELLDVDSQGQEIARLPSGSQFLILSGADAGSVVSAAPRGAAGDMSTSVSALRSRDESLSSGLPIYLIQRGLYYRHIPSLLARLHANHGYALALGLVARIPQATGTSHKALFDRAPTASIRIADPCAYLLDSENLKLPPDPIRKRARQWAPYLVDKDAQDWIEQIVGAQRSAGANLILTPGRALNPDRPQQALDEACTQADVVASLLQPGERMALNLTLSSRWLSSEALRTHLLDQLVDQDQFEILYLRIQWAPGGSFRQMADDSLVTGMKQLSNFCLDEDRRLILPQSGLSGWFSLAFGASGFSAGTSGSDHAFAEYAFRRSAKGAQRVQRYYEPQALHTVERSVHEQLARMADYAACGCVYCRNQESRIAWSNEIASLHHLMALGALTAKVELDSGRGGRHGAVRRMVKEAIKYCTEKPLVGDNVPRHLPIWDQAL